MDWYWSVAWGLETLALKYHRDNNYRKQQLSLGEQREEAEIIKT